MVNNLDMMNDLDMVNNLNIDTPFVFSVGNRSARGGSGLVKSVIAPR